MNAQHLPSSPRTSKSSAQTFHTVSTNMSTPSTNLSVSLVRNCRNEKSHYRLGHSFLLPSPAKFTLEWENAASRWQRPPQGLARSPRKLMELGTSSGHQEPSEYGQISLLDFPGGPVVKSPPANAGDVGSSPGLGRPHMPRGMKPVSPRARTQQKEKPRQWEACTLQLSSSPSSLQLEKSSLQQQRPSIAKNNKQEKYIKKKSPFCRWGDPSEKPGALRKAAQFTLITPRALCWLLSKSLPEFSFLNGGRYCNQPISPGGWALLHGSNSKGQEWRFTQLSPTIISQAHANDGDAPPSQF